VGRGIRRGEGGATFMFYLNKKLSILVFHHQPPFPNVDNYLMF